MDDAEFSLDNLAALPRASGSGSGAALAAALDDVADTISMDDFAADVDYAYSGGDAGVDDVSIPDDLSFDGGGGRAETRAELESLIRRLLGQLERRVFSQPPRTRAQPVYASALGIVSSLAETVPAHRFQRMVLAHARSLPALVAGIVADGHGDLQAAALRTLQNVAMPRVLMRQGVLVPALESLLQSRCGDDLSTHEQLCSCLDWAASSMCEHTDAEQARSLVHTIVMALEAASGSPQLFLPCMRALVTAGGASRGGIDALVDELQFRSGLVPLIISAMQVPDVGRACPGQALEALRMVLREGSGDSLADMFVAHGLATALVGALRQWNSSFYRSSAADTCHALICASTEGSNRRLAALLDAGVLEALVQGLCDEDVDTEYVSAVRCICFRALSHDFCGSGCCTSGVGTGQQQVGGSRPSSSLAVHRRILRMLAQSHIAAGVARAALALRDDGGVEEVTTLLNRLLDAGDGVGVEPSSQASSATAAAAATCNAFVADRQLWTVLAEAVGEATGSGSGETRRAGAAAGRRHSTPLAAFTSRYTDWLALPGELRE